MCPVISVMSWRWHSPPSSQTGQSCGWLVISHSITLARKLHRLGIADRDARAIGGFDHACHDDAPVPVVVAMELLHCALPARADRPHCRMPAEIWEVEVQREAGLEKIVAWCHLVVCAVDIDARHLLSPRTAFEVDVPFEVLPKQLQAAFERLHGARCKRAEGFAGAQETGMHFQNL